jgi:hypothetical protein
MVIQTRNLQNEAISAESVKPIALENIDPDASYEVVIQCGARRRWRSFSSGRWVQVNEDDNHFEMQHVPAIHETGPILGSTLLGLIQGHNAWTEANQRREVLQGTNSTTSVRGRPTPRRAVTDGDTGQPVYAGDVSKQLLVVRYEPSKKMPTDAKGLTGQAQMIKSIVAETISTTIKSLVEEGILVPGNPQSSNSGNKSGNRNK